jgi:hypothetical protein
MTVRDGPGIRLNAKEEMTDQESAVKLVGPGPHWLNAIQQATARENGDNVVITLKYLDGGELQTVQTQMAYAAADAFLGQLARAVAMVAEKRAQA